MKLPYIVLDGTSGLARERKERTSAETPPEQIIELLNLKETRWLHPEPVDHFQLYSKITCMDDNHFWQRHNIPKLYMWVQRYLALWTALNSLRVQLYSISQS